MTYIPKENYRDTILDAVERRIKDMRHDNATGHWQVWGRDRLIETARKIVDGLANDNAHQLKYLDRDLMNAKSGSLLNKKSMTFQNLIGKVIADDIWNHAEPMLDRAYDTQRPEFRQHPDNFPKNFVMPPYDHKSPPTDALVYPPSGGPRR
jgi:hypothetical protein